MKPSSGQDAPAGAWQLGVRSIATRLTVAALCVAATEVGLHTSPPFGPSDLQDGISSGMEADYLVECALRVEGPRVITLGSSEMRGWRIPPETAIPQRLAERLSADTGRPWQVCNFAADAGSPLLSAIMVERLKIRPEDTIVSSINLRKAMVAVVTPGPREQWNVHYLPGDHPVRRYLASLQPEHWQVATEFALQHALVDRLVLGQLRGRASLTTRVEQTITTGRPSIDADRLSRLVEPLSELTAKQLELHFQVLAAAPARSVVVTPPVWRRGLQEAGVHLDQPSLTEKRACVRRLGRQYGINVIDLFEVELPDEAFINFDHFTPFGSQAVAGLIADRIREPNRR